MRPLLVPLALALSVATARAQAPDPAVLETTNWDLDLRIDYEEGILNGHARLALLNTGDRAVSVVPLLLYRLMGVEAVRDADGRPLDVEQDVVVFEDWPAFQILSATIHLRDPVPPGGSTTLEVDWSGPLRGYAEVMGYVRDRIDPAFTIVRPDAWAYPQVGIPSFAAIRRAGLDAFDYRARITVPATTEAGDSLVVANGGRLVDRVDGGDGTITWTYENRAPAWRMDFAIAPYGVLERGDLRVYHFPADSAGARRALATLEATMDLYTRWLGPRRGDGGFAILELEEGFGAQADVTSILQPAAAFRDSTRVREIYHEIKHLWDPESTDEAPPRWNEGLATWFEYRTADVLGGAAVRVAGDPATPSDPDGARPGRSRTGLEERVGAVAAWVLDRFAKEPRYASTPMIEYGEAGLTDLSYSVGFLMFDTLHRLVGDAEFLAIVGGFYQRYAETGATTDAFVRFADATSRRDLTSFFEEWLYTTRWYERLRGGTPIDELPAAYGRPAAPGPSR